MRWLTARELGIELGCDSRYVHSLYKKGLIQGVGTNQATLRYLDPGPELAARIHLKPIDTAALITAEEFAAIMGFTRWAVLKQIERGHIKPSLTLRTGKMSMHFFNRLDVRAILAKREGRRGRGKFTYSPLIVKWLRDWIASQQTPVQVLDSLIHEVAKNVPEPEKTKRIKRLWDLFEEVNEILKTG